LVEDMSRGEIVEVFQENLILLNFLKQGVVDIIHISDKN